VAVSYLSVWWQLFVYIFTDAAIRLMTIALFLWAMASDGQQWAAVVIVALQFAAVAFLTSKQTSMLRRNEVDKRKIVVYEPCKKLNDYKDKLLTAAVGKTKAGQGG
jgi:hypothetical protein